MFRLLIIAVSIAVVSSAFTFSVWPFHFGWTTTNNDIPTGQNIEESIPYMASIIENETYMCSGAIINKRTILTAANCLIGLNKDSTKIGVGLTSHTIQEHLIPITNWIIHEKFNSTTMDNNIAIILLTDDIPQKNGKISSVSMADRQSEIPAGVDGVIGCWETEILKVSNSPIVTSKVCSKLVINEINERNICAGKFDGSINKCQQDSGSPIVVQHKLIGIASWGYGCMKFEEPVVYTKISVFRDWIDNKMKI